MGGLHYWHNLHYFVGVAYIIDTLFFYRRGLHYWHIFLFTGVAYIIDIFFSLQAWLTLLTHFSFYRRGLHYWHNVRKLHGKAHTADVWHKIRWQESPQNQKRQGVLLFWRHQLHLPGGGAYFSDIDASNNESSEGKNAHIVDLFINSQLLVWALQNTVYQVIYASCFVREF